MAEETKKAEGERDPRRAEGEAKIAGGRYAVDPKTGVAKRTEGPGVDDDARKGGLTVKKGKE